MFTVPLPWPDSSLLLALPWPHLSPVLRLPLIAAIVAVPLVLLLYLYRYELRLVRRGTAAGLLALRLTVLAIVLFLVCLQPVAAHDRRREVPGRVLVVVDRSKSMDLPDPQRSPADKLRLLRALKLVPGDVPTPLVEQWITAADKGREPDWLLPDEEKTDGQRGERKAARRKAYEGLLAQADLLTRTATAKRILAPDGLDVLGAIKDRHEVELWGIDRDVRELKADDLEALFAPGGDGGFTDLGAPLSRAQQRVGGKGEVLGVVMLTDGQHNSGPAPGDLARALGQRKLPIFPVALGDRRSPPDVAIVAVRSPAHNFYKGVEGMIDVRVKVAGLPAGEYMVELKQEGNKDELTPPKTIRHEGKDQVYTLAFPVKLDRVGPQTLTAVVKPPEVKEALTDNNSLSTTVSVADDRVKVLLVDGVARWEFHYLATALARDRLVDLHTVLFNPPRLEKDLSPAQLDKLGLPAQQWPKDEEALSAFGCVILGDVDAEQLTLEQRQRLERYVGEAGGTLIVVAGKQSVPLGLPATTPTGEADPLRKLLPIEAPRVLAPEEGFALSLTRAGREARFMELEADREENDTLWAGHPRPWGWAVAGTAKPGATPLAGWLDPKDAALKPTERERKNAVVVRHNYGFGRVLFVGIDSTWRWRFRVGDLYHHRFWGQVVRWAAADRPLAAGNEWIRFGTPQPVYRPGEAVDVSARLAERLGPIQGELLAGARIIALPTKEGDPEKQAALVQLNRPAARPRALEGQVRDLPPGRYAVELAIPDLADRLLTPAKEGEPARPLRTTFTVSPPESRELIELETNQALLDDLAVRSGGRVFTPADVAELRDLLANRSLVEVDRHAQKVYQWWGTLVLVLLLLTAEWVSRKMAGLP